MHSCRPAIDYTKFTDFSKDNRSENTNTSVQLVENSEIQKSSIINFNLDWFYSLNGIQKLCLTLLLCNYMIFSSLMSIIFIFFWTFYLIKLGMDGRTDGSIAMLPQIEEKYPKLANIIKLRRKFTKYYLIINCLSILIIIFFRNCILYNYFIIVKL
jgi:hypothetical protein